MTGSPIQNRGRALSPAEDVAAPAAKRRRTDKVDHPSRPVVDAATRLPTPELTMRESTDGTPSVKNGMNGTHALYPADDNDDEASANMRWFFNPIETPPSPDTSSDNEEPDPDDVDGIESDDVLALTELDADIPKPLRNWALVYALGDCVQHDDEDSRERDELASLLREGMLVENNGDDEEIGDLEYIDGPECGGE